jgi:tetratricopeptide (TPR) repeat protein
LDAAQASLEKAERMQPGQPEVGALRKRLEAKKAEAALNAARDQERLQEESNRRIAAEVQTTQAEELFRHGRYEEALAIAEEQLRQDASQARPGDLRLRAGEAQRWLKSFESAMSAGKPFDALTAFERLEHVNPLDPNLPALKRRLESNSRTGHASLSIFPLGDAAGLLLDDRGVGTNGELAEHSVPAGRHRIAARNGHGPEVSISYDFADGQRVFLVYDVARQFLRPMTESDREAMSRSKARQRTESFAAEHIHGIFRGSCKGSLIVGFHDVVYRPDSGDHGFNMPFNALKLRIENRTATLLFAADNRTFESYRLQDAAAALALKKFWDELSSLEK